MSALEGYNPYMSSETTTKIRQNLERITRAIGEAAARTGRSGKDIRLVAVSKTARPEGVLEAFGAGVTTFAENRVQDAEVKIAAAAQPGLEWHMVGHLQTNKVKTAVSLFSLIQSIDSVRLAKTVSDEGLAQNKVVPVLLEVNISGEAQKYGFGADEIYSAIDEIAQLPGIRVEGLMGIGPNEVPDEAKRAAFKKLKGIFSVCKTLKKGNVEMKTLSMGMSDDFAIAIEEGSNMVRIGRAIFK